MEWFCSFFYLLFLGGWGVGFCFFSFFGGWGGSEGFCVWFGFFLYKKTLQKHKKQKLNPRINFFLDAVKLLKNRVAPTLICIV